MPLAERDRVRIERVADTRTASMDMGLLRLALRNLLANALRYSAPGSAVTLRVSDSDEPLALVLDVIDNGPGIQPELLPRLFERGTRGRATPPGVPATGLGLYIVRRALELQGGRAELVATGSAGTTMRLWIAQRRRAPGRCRSDSRQRRAEPVADARTRLQRHQHRRGALDAAAQAIDDRVQAVVAVVVALAAEAPWTAPRASPSAPPASRKHSSTIMSASHKATRAPSGTSSSCTSRSSFHALGRC